MTAEPDYNKIQNLTFATTTAEHRKDTRASWGVTEVLASAAVMVFILGAYLYFRG
jgi:SSS family solute:Na+ symporter